MSEKDIKVNKGRLSQKTDTYRSVFYDNDIIYHFET